MNQAITIFWFRRDLRLDDNAGLYHALNSGLPVQPVFIFDSDILDLLEDKRDRRLVFIHDALAKLNRELIALGSSLMVRYGKPLETWKKIIQEYPVKAIFANHDYEPYARRRDQQIGDLLKEHSIPFHTFKDQVVFEKSEVMKNDGTPYVVFTPFRNRWLDLVSPKHRIASPSGQLFKNFLTSNPLPLISLEEIGFEYFTQKFPDPAINPDILLNYSGTRDFPAKQGTSRLSIHLRFGTVSVRKLYRDAWDLNKKWVDELIWREFYMYILWHFPHVENEPFKSQYKRLAWLKDEDGFQRWCTGQTGFPIVDAGMRELNATGFMHNRLRMITSMFLTKYLLIDWKWGEAYFAKKLSDFELSSNNGGWQWSAGTGVDAAPYFRIMSMAEQTKKFDPEFEYIRKWVPEFRDEIYPSPIVDYSFARKRCLEFYKNGVV